MIRGVYGEEFSTDSISLMTPVRAERRIPNFYKPVAPAPRGEKVLGSITCKKMQGDKKDMSFKLV